MSEVTGQQDDTIYTYGDADFRYLRATGLFGNGKSLRFSECEEYLDLLWRGAALPTDNASKAIEAIHATAAIIESKAKGEGGRRSNSAFVAA